MKPTDSSEKGHGGVGNAAAQPSNGVQQGNGLQPGSTPPGRSVSGVVAAPRKGEELEEGHTTVDAGPARRFEESQAALSHRIRNAMDQTLPLGMPVPDASLFAEARQNRALHARTMLLGGRHLAGVGAVASEVSPEPSPQPQPHWAEPQTRRAEPAARSAEPTVRWAEPETRRAEPPSYEVVTPRVPDLVSPTRRMPLGYEDRNLASPAVVAPAASAPAASAQEVYSPEAIPREGALRASFVRPVGPPTVPPPRRRRTLPPGAYFAPEEEHEHEAFALDRPRGSSFPPVTSSPGAAPGPSLPGPSLPGTSPPRTSPGAGPGHSMAVSSTVVSPTDPVPRAGSMPRAGSTPRFAAVPDARNPRSNALSNSVILPPPPQASDYELSSSPSAAPPPLALAATARADSGPGAAATPTPGRAAIDRAALDRAALDRAALDRAPLDRAAAPRAVAAPGGAARALTTKPAARPTVSLLDLPSADPLAGYEAPREGFLQRFLIVFIVALAVVGLFALGAIALGFLGKTGW